MPSEASTVGGGQSVEELRRELAEAREQQAATAGILTAISNSPTDAHGVFAEIAARAARLCDAYDAAIAQVDGDVLRIVAHDGPIPVVGIVPIGRGVVMGRAVIERQIVHITDVQAEAAEYPEGSEWARRLGHRSMVAVPLARAGEAIGVIALRRMEKRPFSDRQIALLKTFADQAVIAIENARLFEAEQARTRESKSFLEYQIATSEILTVISRSPNDASSPSSTRSHEPPRIFVRLNSATCAGSMESSSILQASTAFRWKATRLCARGYPMTPGRGTATARSILSGGIEEILDVHADLEMRRAATQES